MDIRAAEISDIIRKQIENYDKKVSVTETGTVLTAGDGIARVYGLSGAQARELLDFECRGRGDGHGVDRRRRHRSRLRPVRRASRRAARFRRWWRRDRARHGLAAT